MKPDSHSWQQLHDHAESRLRPGLAARTLRAAHAASDNTLVRQFAFSAAAAGVCLLLVIVVHGRLTQAETARNLEGWQAIAHEAHQLAQLP